MTRRYYADSVRAHQEGNLVEYSAYEKLEAQNAELRAENESLKSELTENQKYAIQLEKRVAELEGDFKLIEAALLARKAINDGAVDIPADIDSAEKFIAWIKEEPVNDG